jgi:hypothetical protein
MAVEFYPPSLKVVVQRGGKGLDRTEVSVYCRQCFGEDNLNFGHLILMYVSLREALNFVAAHDQDHLMTIVDQGAFGFGLF